MDLSWKNYQFFKLSIRNKNCRKIRLITKCNRYKIIILRFVFLFFCFFKFSLIYQPLQFIYKKGSFLCLSIRLSALSHVSQSVCQSALKNIYLSRCLFIKCLAVYQSIHLSYFNRFVKCYKLSGLWEKPKIRTKRVLILQSVFFSKCSHHSQLSKSLRKELNVNI